MTLYSDFTSAPAGLFERYESCNISCGFPAAHLIPEIICWDSKQEFVFNLLWIWAWYRQEHTPFTDLSRRKAGNYFFWLGTKCQARDKGSWGMLFPIYRMCLVFPAIAPTAVNLQHFTFCQCHPVRTTPEMLPLLRPWCYCSCQDSLNVASEGGRAAASLNWSVGTVCV